MGQSRLRLRHPWTVQFFWDGSAVAYQPFSGELHALPAQMAKVLKVISSGSLSEIDLIQILAAGLSEVDSLELTHQLEQAVSCLLHELSLVELVSSSQ